MLWCEAKHILTQTDMEDRLSKPQQPGYSESSKRSEDWEQHTTRQSDQAAI